jgi:cation diffusion facilitator CzcD-associated flavoprotein CzcO
MGAVLNQDERLMKMLIPDFPVGCRRITPGITYLKALTQPNVQVTNEGIQEVIPEGIKLENRELIELDAIVCATGFDVSFVPRFPMIGEFGNLQDIWKKELPAAYMSCMVPGMPNYFSKPNTLSITGSATNPYSSFPRPQRPDWPRQRPHYR